MAKSATSRASALIRRAGRRALLHRAGRSLLRGLAVSAFVAGAAIVLLRKSGYGPDSWSLAALVPGVAVALHGLRHSRPGRRAAALLLDRAADTKERFTAASEAPDSEVRELAAEQAMRSPAISEGRFPVRFPPSHEGLAAALSLFLLAGFALLVPRGPAEEPGSAAAFPAPDSGRGASSAGRSDAPDGVPAPAPDPGEATAAASRVEAAIAAGEEPTEEDWARLRDEGLARRVRGEIEAAALRGNRAEAVEALRAAVARARGVRGTESEPPTEAQAPASWADYRSGEAAPAWSPRYDRVVRAYFEATR